MSGENALSDYQVLVNVTGCNFPTNAEASGTDIRFMDEDVLDVDRVNSD